LTFVYKWVILDIRELNPGETIKQTFNKGEYDMSRTNYPGINYAGKLAPETNRDNKAGIRYGVISANDVMQAWRDSSEPEYANCCPHCGNEPKSGNDIHDMKRCPSCCKRIDESDFYNEEPITWKIDDGEYKAESDSCGDIVIIQSPYYTYAQFCSPCAPGACHLNNPLESLIEDNKCYCFGHDFFDDGKAPYTVYSVETNEIINPFSPAAGL
jgi:hypothetical protein